MYIHFEKECKDIFFSGAILLLYPISCLLIGSYILFLRTNKGKPLSRKRYNELRSLMSVLWYIKLVEGTIEAPLQFTLTVSYC